MASAAVIFSDCTYRIKSPELRHEPNPRLVPFQLALVGNSRSLDARYLVEPH